MRLAMRSAADTFYNRAVDGAPPGRTCHPRSRPSPREGRIVPFKVLTYDPKPFAPSLREEVSLGQGSLFKELGYGFKVPIDLRRVKSGLLLSLAEGISDRQRR